MYRFILQGKKIYVFDKTDKEFREKYGGNFEQIGTIKDQDSIELVKEKLVKQYRAEEVILDCKIKKKFGWKYYTEETKEKIRQKFREQRRNRKLSEHHIKRISEGRTGRPGNHTGHKHSETTKNIQSLRNKDLKATLGYKWCHDPVTGKEYRLKDKPLPEGLVWGRNPELEVGNNLKKP